MLKTININKSIDGKSILKSCSVELNDSKIIGLVGINGAGKTTLMKCMSGIYDVDSGSVELDDKDIYANPETKNNIFLVLDDLHFKKWDTPRTLKEFYKTFYDFDDSRFLRYIELFNLPMDKNIRSFSKGMKRQTFLAIALAIAPRYLLLDEAFDGLDIQVKYLFKRQLQKDLVETKSTILISSHSLKELNDICDSYYLIDDGVIKTNEEIQKKFDYVSKLQFAFDKDVDVNDILKDFKVISINKEGRVYSAVVEGDIDAIKTALNEFNPLFMDSTELDFEQLITIEMEDSKRG